MIINAFNSIFKFLSGDNKNQNIISIIDTFPGFEIIIKFLNDKISQLDFINKEEPGSRGNIYKCYPSTIDKRMSGLFFRYDDGKKYGFINFKKLKEFNKANVDVKKIEPFLAQELKSFSGNKSSVFSQECVINGFNIKFQTFLEEGDHIQIKNYSKVVIDEKQLLKKIKTTISGTIIINPVDKTRLNTKIILEEFIVIEKECRLILDSKSNGLLYTEDLMFNFIASENYNTPANKNILISCCPHIYERVEPYLKKFNIKHKNLVNSFDFTKEHSLGIYQILHRIIHKKITTDTGININVEKTSAMWCLDINSGSFGNKENDIYSNIYAVNSEALKRIMDWAWLTGMDGLITIDFIDMYRQEDRKKLQDLMTEEAAKYCKSTKVSKLNSFSIATFSKTRSGKCLHTKYIHNLSNMNNIHAIYVLSYIMSNNKENKLKISLSADVLDKVISHLPNEFKYFILSGHKNLDKTLSNIINADIEFAILSGNPIPTISTLSLI